MRVFIADLFDTNELFMFQHSSIPLAGRAGVILVSECVDFSRWKFLAATSDIYSSVGLGRERNLYQGSEWQSKVWREERDGASELLLFGLNLLAIE